MRHRQELLLPAQHQSMIIQWYKLALEHVKELTIYKWLTFTTANIYPKPESVPIMMSLWCHNGPQIIQIQMLICTPFLLPSHCLNEQLRLNDAQIWAASLAFLLIRLCSPDGCLVSMNTICVLCEPLIWLTDSAVMIRRAGDSTVCGWPSKYSHTNCNMDTDSAAVLVIAYLPTFSHHVTPQPRIIYIVSYYVWMVISKNCLQCSLM